MSRGRGVKSVHRGGNKGRPIWDENVHSPGDSLAEALESARLTLGLSMDDIERACHLNRGTYMRLLDGKFEDAAILRITTWLEGQLTRSVDTLVNVSCTLASGRSDSDD